MSWCSHFCRYLRSVVRRSNRSRLRPGRGRTSRAPSCRAHLGPSGPEVLPGGEARARDTRRWGAGVLPVRVLAPPDRGRPQGQTRVHRRRLAAALAWRPAADIPRTCGQVPEHQRTCSTQAFAWWRLRTTQESSPRSRLVRLGRVVGGWWGECKTLALRMWWGDCKALALGAPTARHPPARRQPWSRFRARSPLPVGSPRRVILRSRLARGACSCAGRAGSHASAPSSGWM
jgi:hypothetical protein